jgi:multiple RNA-binding domain-containing protein 1
MVRSLVCRFSEDPSHCCGGVYFFPWRQGTHADLHHGQGAKDAPTPRPNKRQKLVSVSAEHAPPVSETVKKTSSKDANSKAQNPQFAQFMEVMQPRSNKGPSWANETETGGLRSTSKPIPSKTKSHERDLADGNVGVSAGAGEETQQQESGMSDLDWMKRRMTTRIDSADAEAGEMEPQTCEQSGHQADTRRSGSHPVSSSPALKGYVLLILT